MSYAHAAALYATRPRSPARAIDYIRAAEDHHNIPAEQRLPLQPDEEQAHARRHLGHVAPAPEPG